MCELADLEFQDARSQKVRVLKNTEKARLVEAVRKAGTLSSEFANEVLTMTFNNSIEKAAEANTAALKQPQRLDLAARACRRSSGASSELADVHWHRNEVTAAVATAKRGLTQAREGLNHATTAQVTVQFRALYFNALANFSILHIGTVDTDRQALFETTNGELKIWYDELRRLDGDGKDIRELQQHTPGWTLLEKMIRSSNGA